MELVIEGYGLRMTVVNKESLGLLDEAWDQRGLYFLLGRAAEPDRYNPPAESSASTNSEREIRERSPLSQCAKGTSPKRPPLALTQAQSAAGSHSH